MGGLTYRTCKGWIEVEVVRGEVGYLVGGDGDARGDGEERCTDKGEILSSSHLTICHG